MSSSLLDRFLSEEATPHVRKLLATAVAMETGRRHFEFNLFEITLQPEIGDVVIQDVLDPTGTEVVTLGRFIEALGCPA